MNAILAEVALVEEELLGFVGDALHELLEAADGVEFVIALLVGRHAELDDSIAVSGAMVFEHSGIGQGELELAVMHFGLDAVILLHEVGDMRGRDDEHDVFSHGDALDAIEVLDDFGLVVDVDVGGLSVAHVVGVWFWVSSTSAAHRDW